METITQTNRTILFTEMNPERLNLLTLIGDVRGKSSLDDDKVKEINDELLVGSFEEFMEKFSPVVYSWCDAPTGNIQYSLKKPETIPPNCITEIPLNESNDLLNMLVTLLGAFFLFHLQNLQLPILSHAQKPCLEIGLSFSGFSAFQKQTSLYVFYRQWQHR